MNPHQQNKIDINERKYFDSGDYAMSKAGKASDVTTIGSRHPLPENIPHLTASSPPQVTATPNIFNGHAPVHSHSGGANSGMPLGMARSPIKEGSFLQRQANMEDTNDDDGGSNSKEENRPRLETRESPKSRVSMSERKTDDADDSSPRMSEIPIRR
ncbi:hypothetical protein MauCBS54593_005969 [Microsporum audouinii]